MVAERTFKPVPAQANMMEWMNYLPKPKLISNELEDEDSAKKS